MPEISENELPLEVDLRKRLTLIKQRVDGAAHSAGRDSNEVRILLATKEQPPDTVNAVIAASREVLGYALSAESRVDALHSYSSGSAIMPDSLHFIGHLQTNKVASVLATVSLLESVDRPRLVEVLERRLTLAQQTLNVFIQVNVSNEPSKNGVDPTQAWALVEQVAASPVLTLKGFMTIGLNSTHPEAVRSGYRDLRRLRDRTRDSGMPGTAEAYELSMGMSGDLELAIAEGATIVRVGTAIFGNRST